MQIDSQDRISAPLSAWWTIIVLMLLSLYTIADRPLFNLLVEPIRKELLLSDFQIGMVQGLSVALLTAKQLRNDRQSDWDQACLTNTNKGAGNKHLFEGSRQAQ